MLLPRERRYHELRAKMLGSSGAELSVIDVEKRKRVMARSMQLGHCICNPKKPCPCDVLREKDVCPCAGERLDVPAGPVRLTELVESAGCASKIDPADAAAACSAGLPSVDDPRVLVGMPAGDDAGVYQLDDETALVQTVDVFSPSVDDPYTVRPDRRGQFAERHLRHGRPADHGAVDRRLSHSHTLPDDVLQQILRGGIDKMTEAGVAVIGGHSINDTRDQGRLRRHRPGPSRRGSSTNAGARPGDRLILTKPLGTGIMAFAAQIGRAPAGALRSGRALDGHAEPTAPPS